MTLRNIACTAAFSLMLSAGAGAQETATPEVRAYQVRINNEVNANLQCSIIALTLQDRVKALETELAKLKSPDK